VSTRTTGRDVDGPPAGERSRSGVSVLLSVLPQMRTTGLAREAAASDLTIPTRRVGCNQDKRRGRARLQPSGAAQPRPSDFSAFPRCHAAAAKKLQNRPAPANLRQFPPISANLARPAS
jgi:hypothetical protein